MYPKKSNIYIVYWFNMKMSNDQLDFNFSRRIDLQRNLNFRFLDTLLFDLFDKNKSEF